MKFKFLSKVKNPFQPGSVKIYETQVTQDKLATFESGTVHPVYSTFALGKDAEWACRLFVLEMKEEGEEGIGTYLSISHLFPAPLHSKVRIEATLMEVKGNKVICTYQAFANGRLIAEGDQVQKIIIQKRFMNLIDEITV